MKQYTVTFCDKLKSDIARCYIEAETPTGALDKACVWFSIEYSRFIKDVYRVVIDVIGGEL